jgi:uncharacterized membrane protein
MAVHKPSRKTGRKLPSLSTLLRSYFIAGTLVFIPLWVTGWMIFGVAKFLWSFKNWLPSSWQETMAQAPQALVLPLEAAFAIGVALGFALLISMLGWISQRYLGRKLLELLAEVIQRIPVLRSVYSALDQMLRAFGSGGGKQFSRVVYLEYPRQGIWTLGFVTGSARVKSLPEGLLNVFVPTTPNPTGGFYLLVPESQVRESPMGVEDAFRTILSLGVAGNPSGGGEKNG